MQPNEKETNAASGENDASGAELSEAGETKPKPKKRGLFKASDFPPAPDWMRRPPRPQQGPTLFDHLDKK